MAKKRGNALKSTASIAIQVISIVEAINKKYIINNNNNSILIIIIPFNIDKKFVFNKEFCDEFKEEEDKDDKDDVEEEVEIDDNKKDKL